MEPLANAAKSALESEIHLTHCRRHAAAESSGDLFAELAAFTIFDRVSLRLDTSMTEIDEVISVLAFAHEADEKIRAGEEMGVARSGSQREHKNRITAKNGQVVIWSGA